MQAPGSHLSATEQALKAILTSNAGALLLSQLGDKLGSTWRQLQKAYPTLSKLLAEFPHLLKVVNDARGIPWVVLTRPFLLPLLRNAQGKVVHKACPMNVLAKGAGYGSAAELLGAVGSRAEPRTPNPIAVSGAAPKDREGSSDGQKTSDLMSRIRHQLRESTMKHLDGIPVADLPSHLPPQWTQLDPTPLALLRRFSDVVQTYSRPNKGLWAVMIESQLLKTVRAELAQLFAKSGRSSYGMDQLRGDFSSRADLQYLTSCTRCGNLQQFLTKVGFYVDKDSIVHLEKPVVQTNHPATQTPAARVPEAGGSAARPATEPVIVRDVQHCRQVVALLEREQPIAVDLEGALWGKVIDINLIQIADKSGCCFLFDLVQPEAARLFTEGGLGRLLEDVRVLKVGHDLRSDATALFKQFNIFMNHAFDTQVGHACLASNSKQASLNEVLQHYAGVKNTLKSLMKFAHEDDSSYWRQRPLTPEMIDYAADDVRFLLRAFDRMASQLEQQNLYESALSHSRARMDRARLSKPRKEPPLPTVVPEEKWTVSSNCSIKEDVEDMSLIIDALPCSMGRALMESESVDLNTLIEIIMDLGRPPRARFAGSDGAMRFVEICKEDVTSDDLESFCASITNFDHENRAGISKTLHRISRLDNRAGYVVGLTIRVGKTIRGLVEMIRDVLSEAAAQKSSILLLGPPGMGKTSVIREMARVLANEEAKSVMIVDTSNEIAGDGDVPHPAIGSARRMQVPEAAMQHKRMIEAVQNHTPDVVIVDEIGTRDESAACCTIARRGVMLIATAHGVTLKDVIDNPSLNSVLGGIENVILGDKAMEERQLKQKTVREAKGPAAFEIAIELRSRAEWVVHRNVRQNVNLILEDKPFLVEERRRMEDGQVVATRKSSSYSSEQSNGGLVLHYEK